MITTEEFAQERRCLDKLKKGKEEYLVLEGSDSKFLLSAPHAIGQVRLGMKKGAEPSTASLALVLQKLTNCHAIIKVANENNDANFDEKSVYKTKMEQVVREKDIKFILDLHGLASTRKVLINSGVYHGQLLQTEEKLKHFNKFEDILLGNGFNPIADNPFSGGPLTIAYHFGKDEGIFSIQVEVNSRIFMRSNENRLNRLINALKQFIKYAENLSSKTS